MDAADCSLDRSSCSEIGFWREQEVRTASARDASETLCTHQRCPKVLRCLPVKSVLVAFLLLFRQRPQPTSGKSRRRGASVHGPWDASPIALLIGTALRDGCRCRQAGPRPARLAVVTIAKSPCHSKSSLHRLQTNDLGRILVLTRDYSRAILRRGLDGDMFLSESSLLKIFCGV